MTGRLCANPCAWRTGPHRLRGRGTKDRLVSHVPESGEGWKIDHDGPDAVAKVVTAIVQAEMEHDERIAILNTLTEPIDDPDATDPKTQIEAKRSVYWEIWLGAIYEELESLKTKGVTNMSRDSHLVERG